MIRKIKQLVFALMERSPFFEKLVNMVLPLRAYFLKRKKNRIFLKKGGDVLAGFKAALDRENLKFWLTCGTLLGAYREHALLGHDLDLDVAMFASDMEKAHAALVAGGFELENEFGVVGEDIKERSYRCQDVKIDIFFVEETEEHFLAHVFFREKESSRTDDFKVIQIFFPRMGFKEYEFLGNRFLVPDDTERYLAANYGPNFMTPDKKWDYRKDIPCAKYYDLEEKRGFWRYN